MSRPSKRSRREPSTKQNKEAMLRDDASSKNESSPARQYAETSTGEERQQIETSTAEGPKGETAHDLTKRLQTQALTAERKRQRERGRAKMKLKVIEGKHSPEVTPMESFRDLANLLPKHLLDAISDMGFDRPSSFQREVLPRILADPPRNVVGQHCGGTGTASAYVIGMLHRIAIDNPATVQAICVLLTRETTVATVHCVIKPIAAYMKGLNVQLAVGGGESAEQKTKSLVHAHLVVGVPEVIADWLERKIIKATNIKVIVMDSLDLMLPDKRSELAVIKRHVPGRCQYLLFSGTFPPYVDRFAAEVAHDEDRIVFERETEIDALDAVMQLRVDCRNYDGGKLAFMSDMYSLLTSGQSVVVVGTQRGAEEVYHVLTAQCGYSCSLLHGAMDSMEQHATMEAFRSGKNQVLVTTHAMEVNADNVCLVVNYDAPLSREGRSPFQVYLQQVGLASERKGIVINLIADQSSVDVLDTVESHFPTYANGVIQDAPPDPEIIADVIEN